MQKPPPDPIGVLRGHTSPCNSIQFIDDNIIFSGDGGGNIKVWNLGLRRVVISNRGHSDSILSVHSFGNNKSASCSRDGSVKIWDLEVGLHVHIHALETGSRHFCNSSCSNGFGDSNLIVTPSVNESEIIAWDIRSAARVSSFNVPPKHGMTTSIVVNDGIFVGLEDGSLSFFDLKSTRECIINKPIHKQPLMAIDAHQCPNSAGEVAVVSGGADDKVMKTNLDISPLEESSCAVSTSQDQTISVDIPSAGTSSIAIRSDCRIIASAHWDSTVRLFDMKKLRPLAVLRHHKESVYSVAFGRAGAASAGVFASGCKDGTIALWDLYADRMKE